MATFLVSLVSEVLKHSSGQITAPVLAFLLSLAIGAFTYEFLVRRADQKAKAKPKPKRKRKQKITSRPTSSKPSARLKSQAPAERIDPVNTETVDQSGLQFSIIVSPGSVCSNDRFHDPLRTR